MTKHEKAVIIDHIISILMHIKSVSMCVEIDRLAMCGVSKLIELAESEKIQKELDVVRKRRIDPTN